MSWQLTRGTSFAEVSTLLCNLNERCQSLTTIFIDNCCKLRNKIQSLLGAHVTVKLDLFHGVQRISRTVSMKYKLRPNCLQDLTLVFRAEGDIEKHRSCATPQPEVILANMNTFVDKWRHIQDANGIPVFAADTLTAIEGIK